MRLTRRANFCDRDLEPAWKSLVRLILWVESWSLPRERLRCWGRKLLSLSLSRPILLIGCCQSRPAVGSRCVGNHKKIFFGPTKRVGLFSFRQNDS
jgi:hypothetical protein